MVRVILILSLIFLNAKALASDEVASGFHLGVSADAGVATVANTNSLIASGGELAFGFQAENGFLVNGIFHGGYLGERAQGGSTSSRTWATTGGGAQVGWKIKRLKLLAGYQWAALEREELVEDTYQTVNDGYYYGPHAGISISLIDRPAIGLDIGTKAAFLRWDERASHERGQSMAMLTSGIHLHLYPAHWDSRGTNTTGHLWFHLPYEATRALLELGPRLTLEILRAAVSIR